MDILEFIWWLFIWRFLCVDTLKFILWFFIRRFVIEFRDKLFCVWTRCRSWRPLGFQHTTPYCCLMFCVLHVAPMEKEFLYFIWTIKSWILNLSLSLSILYNTTLHRILYKLCFLSHVTLFICLNIVCLYHVYFSQNTVLFTRHYTYL